MPRGGRRNHGPRANPRTDKDAHRAFFAQVAPQNSTAPCWRWRGPVQSTSGYARFEYGGHSWNAYLFAFVAMVGEVPRGLDMLARCRREARRG